MDDAARVRGVERVGNLGGEVEERLDRQRLPLDAVLQGLAFRAAPSR
jgi:hypothetical protein